MPEGMGRLLIPESEEEWQELVGRTMPADAFEGMVIVEGNLRSDLNGTRWTLRSIDGNGADYEILPDLADFEDAQRSGTAWGQLRLVHNAFVIRVRCNPVQTQTLFSEDRSTTTATGIWRATRDGAEFMDWSGNTIPARLEEGRIVLTDDTTGLSYTFEADAKPAASEARERNMATDARPEGEGYSSPEDAVMAYIDAFNAGDAQTVLSTFAIETWAEQSEGKATLERFHALNEQNIFNAIPTNGEYSLRMKIAGCYGRLANRLAVQYIARGAPEEYPVSELQYYDLKSAEALDHFWKCWKDAPGTNWAGGIAFVDWIDPKRIRDNMPNGEIAESRLAGLAKENGCDDAVSVAARITINGKNAVLLMDCGKYGGRWYNLTLGGTTAIAVGYVPFETGLILEGTTDWNAVP